MGFKEHNLIGLEELAENANESSSFSDSLKSSKSNNSKKNTESLHVIRKPTLKDMKDPIFPSEKQTSGK